MEDFIPSKDVQNSTKNMNKYMDSQFGDKQNFSLILTRK